jgi:hypothetical protein
MCRSPIYFRGISKALETWEDERMDDHNQSVFTECLDALFEEFETFEMDPDDVLFELMFIEERFNTIVKNGYDPDDFMYDDDIEFYTERDRFIEIYDDCKRRMNNYMFVSKYSAKRVDRSFPDMFL